MLHKISLKVPLNSSTLIFETIVFLFKKYNDSLSKKQNILNAWKVSLFTATKQLTFYVFHRIIFSIAN